MSDIPPPLPPVPPPGPYPGYPFPPPRQPSWFSRNWPWFVPVGCVGTLVLLALFGLGIAMGVFGLIKSSEPYQTAMTRARANPQIAAALGAPIKEPFYVTDGISSGNRSGYANLMIPLSGPKGTGTLYVVAKRPDGVWNYTVMRARVGSPSKDIDLLEDER